MNRVDLYYQFSLIVADVATKTNIPVSYLWGHPIEIIENLRYMSLDPTIAADKYPLIALFTDISETKGKDSGYESDVSLHLIIAINTLKRYSSEERLLNNFIPFLYPIYFQLLKSIAQSPNFHPAIWQNLEHEKSDRFFWGKNGLYLNTGNVFDDLLDVIEIQNLKLTLKRK